MLSKIKRADCLIKYPKFPTSEYNLKTDNEVFTYPKIYALYWLKLESKSKRGLTKSLTIELDRLFKYLNIRELIFLGESKYSWISKSALERDVYKPFSDALNYFTANKIDRQFNGGLQIDNLELSIFIKHFYSLTRCDASVPHIHFMDKEQSLIGLIHYSGEIKFMTLNKKTDKLFLDAVSKTNFLDAFRKNTNRISK